jgi:leucyl aminopeptidase
MRTQGISGNFTEANVEALAIAVFKNEKPTGGILKELDRITGGILAATMKAGEFKGDGGETALIRFAKKGKVKASRLLLIGMGEREEYKASAVSIVSGTATRFFRQRSIKSFALMPRCDGYSVEIAQNATQGVITSLFELDKY